VRISCEKSGKFLIQRQLSFKSNSYYRKSQVRICEFSGFFTFSNFKLELDFKNLSILEHLQDNKKVLLNKEDEGKIV